MLLVFGDPSTVVGLQAVGNESVPKIIINNTINLFSETAISILVISNHNCFRVLFGKIASAYCIWELYLHFSIGNGPPVEPALCQLYRHTFVPYTSYNHSVIKGANLKWSALSLLDDHWQIRRSICDCEAAAIRLYATIALVTSTDASFSAFS